MNDDQMNEPESGTDVLEQGSELSGYEENGPYHCGDCVHLQGGPEAGEDQGATQGICLHPIVALDPALQHSGEGQTLVNLQTGCCRYVKQAPETDEDEPNEEDESGVPSMIRNAYSKMGEGEGE